MFCRNIFYRKKYSYLYIVLYLLYIDDKTYQNTSIYVIKVNLFVEITISIHLSSKPIEYVNSGVDLVSFLFTCILYTLQSDFLIRCSLVVFFLNVFETIQIAQAHTTKYRFIFYQCDSFIFIINNLNVTFHTPQSSNES